MAPPVQRFRYALGLAKEGSWASAAVPSTADQFVPVYNPKIETVIEPIIDEGFRSQASKDFALNQGYRYSRITFEFQPQPQNIGQFMKAMLGGTDTVTGTVNPFTHSIPQLDSGLPPSYTLDLFDGLQTTNSRQILGAYLESIKLDYSVGSGMLKASCSWAGKYEGTVAQPTAVYDAVQPFTPWMNTATVNASTTVGARLIGLAWEAKRPWEGIWGAAGNQDLTNANVGPIECGGSATMYAIDNTDFALYTGNTQGQAQWKFSNTLSPVATLQINQQLTGFESPTVLEATKEFIILSAKFRALRNSTDVGTFAASILNAKSTAY